MNVTSWDTEQNSQTDRHRGQMGDGEEEKEKRRDVEGQKILSDRRNKKR